MLFYLWKQSGADPYKVYNGLGPDYRPLHDPAAEPRPPRFPQRVKAFLYACGKYARELERRDLVEQARMLGKAMGG